MDRLTLLSLVLDIALITLLLVRPAQRVPVPTKDSERRPTPPSR